MSKRNQYRVSSIEFTIARQDRTSVKEATRLWKSAEANATEVSVLRPGSRAAKEAQYLLAKVTELAVKAQMEQVQHGFRTMKIADAALFHNRIIALNDLAVKTRRNLVTA